MTEGEKPCFPAPLVILSEAPLRYHHRFARCCCAVRQAQYDAAARSRTRRARLRGIYIFLGTFVGEAALCLPSRIRYGVFIHLRVVATPDPVATRALSSFATLTRQSPSCGHSLRSLHPPPAALPSLPTRDFWWQKSPKPPGDSVSRRCSKSPGPPVSLTQNWQGVSLGSADKRRFAKRHMHSTAEEYYSINPRRQNG